MNCKEKLLKAFSEDKDFQQELLKCEEKAQAITVAINKVPGITEEEVMECVKEMLQKLSQAQTSYLQEEELKTASDGNTTTTAITVTTITAAASSYAFM